MGSDLLQTGAAPSDLLIFSKPNLIDWDSAAFSAKKKRKKGGDLVLFLSLLCLRPEKASVQSSLKMHCESLAAYCGVVHSAVLGHRSPFSPAFPG